MSIPKIIHQVWFQFPGGPLEPPLEYRQMRASWAEKHPEYQIILWNSASARSFLGLHFPHLLPTYDGYPKEINRVDAIRYCLLAVMGGTYVDCDTESLARLDPLLSHDLVLVKDYHWFLGLNNGFMSAVPNHPLMRRCVENLPKSAKIPNVMAQTGPLYLTANYLSLSTRIGTRILSLEELKGYFRHEHHASWTPVAKWLQALNSDRRQYMSWEQVPVPLRPFLKGKVGQRLENYSSFSLGT